MAQNDSGSPFKYCYLNRNTVRKGTYQLKPKAIETEKWAFLNRPEPCKLHIFIDAHDTNGCQ